MRAAGLSAQFHMDTDGWRDRSEHSSDDKVLGPRPMPDAHYRNNNMPLHALAVVVTSSLHSARLA
jgi:hypothetical protein